MKLRKFISRFAPPAAAFLLPIIVCFFMTDIPSVDSSQAETTKEAVMRAAVSCYAIEGRYPPNIDYLIENYGVAVNEDLFTVHYSTFGSNVMPEIDVFLNDPKGGAYE